MKRIGIIGIAAVSLFVGSTALAAAQRDQPADKPTQAQPGERPADKKDDKQARPGRQAKPDTPPAAQAATPQQPQTRAQQQQQQQDRNTQLKQQQDQKAQQQQQQDRNTQQQQQRAQQQQQQQDRNAQLQQQQGPRLSQPRQKQLVDQQQQRLTQYRQHLDQQQRVLQQQTAQLQQQKRVAQVRFQQDYLARLRQQQVFLNDHHPDYDHDPFFFSVSTFRYNRGGRFYETNRFGADLLRQAVNYGYQEGFNSGAADRQDHWGFSYEASYAYQDANYGYNGYYVERDDYNYYFREGFRRGYDDGYYSRSQYGQNVNGAYVMLEINLSKVLGFEAIR
jgi:hypothetical protein